MQSLIHLYNTALAELGGEQIPTNISSFEDNTVGKICQNTFPHVLDTVLESYEWGFAQKRTVLAKLADQENLTHRQRYALPSDCIRPINVFPLEGELSSSYAEELAYEIEGNALLCDADPVVLIYVARIADPTLYPAYFVELLKWKMASVLATARNNDKQQKQLCEQYYERTLARACALDRTNKRKKAPLSPWQSSRRAGVGRTHHA